jgi:hypothetical protein
MLKPETRPSSIALRLQGAMLKFGTKPGSIALNARPRSTPAETVLTETYGSLNNKGLEVL